MAATERDAQTNDLDETESVENEPGNEPDLNKITEEGEEVETDSDPDTMNLEDGEINDETMVENGETGSHEEPTTTNDDGDEMDKQNTQDPSEKPPPDLSQTNEDNNANEQDQQDDQDIDLPVGRNLRTRSKELNYRDLAHGRKDNSKGDHQKPEKAKEIKKKTRKDATKKNEEANGERAPKKKWTGGKSLHQGYRHNPGKKPGKRTRRKEKRRH